MVAHVLWEHGVAGSNPVNPTRMGISLPMDLTRAGECPGSTTGSAGRRNQHIRDHWQEGSKSVGERRHPSPIRRASPGRSLGSQPSLFRLADYTSPPCDVSEKARPCGCGAVVARLLPKQETAGSNPVIRSIRKTKTMDLIRQWDSQPSFPCGRFRKNMDEQPRHGHAASRNKETCHRPGSSEEEQVPFKHWVRIS